MGYRDELSAALSRLDEAERRAGAAQGEVERLRAELAAARVAERAEPPRRGAGVATAAALLVGAAALQALAILGRGPALLAGAAALGVAALVLAALARLTVQARPGEALVISGVRTRAPDGVLRGYRVVVGDSAMVPPFLGSVARLDLRSRVVVVAPGEVATSSGGRLRATVAASYRLGPDAARLHRAIERFLGRPGEQVERVVADVLGGALRAAAAVQNPEQLTDAIRRAAVDELDRIGVELETLAIRELEAP